MVLVVPSGKRSSCSKLFHGFPVRATRCMGASSGATSWPSTKIRNPAGTSGLLVVTEALMPGANPMMR